MKQNEQELNKILIKVSVNAKNALDAINSQQYLNTSKEEKELCAMSLIILCDIVRLFVAYTKCEKEGIARLLHMADIFSKLYEAKKWYFKTGNKAFSNISKNNGTEDHFANQIKTIKKNFPTEEIESFKEYRNKFSFHYDTNALTFLQDFGNEIGDFAEIVQKCIDFSCIWVQLVEDLIEYNGIKGVSK